MTLPTGRLQPRHSGWRGAGAVVDGTALAERNGLSVEAAFDALRLYARDQNIKLTDLAVTVVHNNFNPRIP